MDFFKKLGTANLVMLALCMVIIVLAEYLFLTGHRQHGIFIGLMAPMLLGLVILFKLVERE